MPTSTNGSAPDLSEKGLSGLKFDTGGTITEEFLPALQGRKAIDVYKQMADNDSLIGSILFAIDMHLRAVQWSVDPNPEAGGRADKDAQFLDECMKDTSHTWSDFVCEIMTMIVYGFSVFEIVYKKRQGPQDETSKTPTSDYDDGRIGWRKFATRSQDSIDRWEFDKSDGSVKAIVQKPPPDFDDIVIPITKALLFRTSTVKNNPEGKSVLRTAYRSWYYKSRIEESEAVGVERDLAGLPVAEVDASILRSDASDAEKEILAAIRRIVTNIRRDKEEGVVWPLVHDANGNSLYNLKLLSSGGSRTFNTSQIIDRYDKRIAMTVLADFIMLGQQAQGSFALASSKTNLFTKALGAWLNVIADVLNTYAVPRLFRVNGMDSTHTPMIKHGDIEEPDLAELGAYLNQLAAVGMPIFPNEKLETHLLDSAGLPYPEQDEKDEQVAGQSDASAMGPQVQQEGPPQEEPTVTADDVTGMLAE